jgi:hypothetical protein
VIFLRFRLTRNEIQNGGTESKQFTQLGERMEIYLLKSRSENTNSKYFITFKRWERFITLEGGKAVPATPIHVVLYLTYLLDNGSSCSTHIWQTITINTDMHFAVQTLETTKKGRVRH